MDNTGFVKVEVLQARNTKVLAIPVKHGRKNKPAHWSINPDGYYPQCSNCGYEPPRELIRCNGDALIFPRYCPECGADTKREVK